MLQNADADCKMQRRPAGGESESAEVRSRTRSHGGRSPCLQDRRVRLWEVERDLLQARNIPASSRSREMSEFLGRGRCRNCPPESRSQTWRMGHPTCQPSPPPRATTAVMMLYRFDQTSDDLTSSETNQKPGHAAAACPSSCVKQVCDAPLAGTADGAAVGGSLLLLSRLCAFRSRKVAKMVSLVAYGCQAQLGSVLAERRPLAWRYGDTATRRALRSRREDCSLVQCMKGSKRRRCCEGGR